MSMEGDLYERVRQLERDMAEVKKRLNMSWSPASYWSVPVCHGDGSPVASGHTPSPPSGGSGVRPKHSYGEAEAD